MLFYYLYLLISFSFFSIEYIFERLQPLALYKCFIVFSCVAYENTEIKKLHTHQVVAVFCYRFFWGGAQLCLIAGTWCIAFLLTFVDVEGLFQF